VDSKLKLNVFWKAIEAVVTMAASFLQLAFIARLYPPTFVGQYQLALAWLFLVTAFACFGGIVMVATRELSGSNDTKSIFSNALMLQIMIGVPVCVICVFIFRDSLYFADLAMPLSIGTVALIGSMILQMSQALLISKEKISSVVVASIVGHLFATVATIVAAFQNLSIVTLVIAWAAYNLVNGLVLLYQTTAWRFISFRLVTIDALRRLSLEILPVLIMILATRLYVRVDVIMLGYFTDSEVVAQYSAGYLFLDQLMILSNFMMSALFPNFARSCSAHGKEYQALYRGILILFLKYLAPIALLIAIFSRFLLSIVYGSEYAEAWGSLSVLMLAAIFAWLNGPSGTIFISLRKQHIYMWATLLSLVVNLVGNLILIPSVGAIGAAISTVLTEAAICGFCLWWIYRETKYLPWMRAIG
jgi:PST family polysaccharide transporter